MSAIVTININEVNKLKNKDTLPSSNPSGLVDDNGEFDPCNTVRGFRTDPDTLDEPGLKLSELENIIGILLNILYGKTDLLKRLAKLLK